MTKRDEITKYVNDIDHVSICPAMAKQFATEEYDSVFAGYKKDKLKFTSREEATNFAERNGWQNEQVAYICQYCFHWHLGGSAKIGTEPRNFAIAVYGNIKTRVELVEYGQSPLLVAIQSLQVEPFEANHIEGPKLQNIIRRCELKDTPKKIRKFSLTPQERAVLWAIHLPKQQQPCFLRVGQYDFAYRSHAGDYWSEFVARGPY